VTARCAIGREEVAMPEQDVAHTRILVAEDHEPFLSFIRFQIQQRPSWTIVCEVSDGLEAVQRAEELQPDLVLLDIGLPRLNGMEVARRIRKISPQTKIVFVTLENSRACVCEAFSLGGNGYVLKGDAFELLSAIEAVLRGERFVSSSLAGYDLFDAADD
jgi:DNA-binding NarL/FixJ family response regulator